MLQNSATTLTGNVIIALPRNKTEYTLGPYFVAGLGLMHAHIEDVLGVLTVGRTMPAMDIGGGVTGNLSERIGLIWEGRYFSSIGQAGSERTQLRRGAALFLARPHGAGSSVPIVQRPSERPGLQEQ